MRRRTAAGARLRSGVTAATLLTLCCAPGGDVEVRRALLTTPFASMRRLPVSVPIPTPLVVEAGRARYRVAAAELASLVPARRAIEGEYRLRNGRVTFFGSVISSCGTTSAITAHGAAYLLRFADPWPATYMIVALAADRLGRREADGRTASWDPASLGLVPARVMGPMCMMQMPPILRARIAGTPARCADPRSLGQCYVEYRDAGARWMAEFHANTEPQVVAAVSALRHFVAAHRLPPATPRSRN